jgi:hypothetical protein
MRNLEIVLVCVCVCVCVRVYCCESCGWGGVNNGITPDVDGKEISEV